MVSLILISVMSCQKTLADLPANLRPSTAAIGTPMPFFCTDRAGAERIAVTFRENVDCHDQLKTVTSTTDWSTVIIAGVASLILGYAIGATR